MAETDFLVLTDDIVLNIFAKLEDDPRHWARLACVCIKFSSLIRDFCWKNKCSQALPSLVSDLLSDSSAPPPFWASLHKLAVCCPGLRQAGVHLESGSGHVDSDAGASGSDGHWSLFDDLRHDAVYDASEPQFCEEVDGDVVKARREFPPCKKRKICRSWRSHLASGIWNLSREQGSKLLARQFRDDCLYICDWPCCVHFEEKRKYRLFRGVFKNFKRTRVWRTINDGKRRKVDLSCAFCHCRDTWDLHSAFCLRRGFGYHNDGEPVVRAYVCENGHVSGTWTDVPMYA